MPTVGTKLQASGSPCDIKPFPQHGPHHNIVLLVPWCPYDHDS